MTVETPMWDLGLSIGVELNTCGQCDIITNNSKEGLTADVSSLHITFKL